jgi:plastocyanin
MTAVVYRLLLSAAMVFVFAIAKASAGEPEVRTVVVKDLAFNPDSIELHVGDTVDWENQDIFVHSATAGNGSFEVELQLGGHGRIVVKAPGVIAYYCKYHPGMKGELRVSE